jgi:hypothetical protein
MKNYTTQTASLKATTIDTRILDTKILKVNGSMFDPNNIKTEYPVRYAELYIGDGTWKDDDPGVWCCTTFNDEGDVAEGGVSGYNWYPSSIHLHIPGEKNYWTEIQCNKTWGSGGWYFRLAEDGDDKSQIYGGLTNNTPVAIYYMYIQY